jgi:hypothetical protein
MKAKLVTYTTKGLSPTERSILSKRINGYLDKSNKAKYTYKRKGLISKLPHIKITNKAFIIRKKDFHLVSKEIKKCKAMLKSWDIDIKQT